MTRSSPWLAALCMAVFTLAPALAAVPAQGASANPVGSWQVNTGEARYEVTSCGKGGALCAQLVWLHPSERTAENLAVLNTYVVRGAQPSAANKWSGNVTFDGRSYDGTMTLNGQNSMTLKGCSGILCQTYKLSRI